MIPAYARVLDFMTNEYLPGARATLGASSAPGRRGLLRRARPPLHDARHRRPTRSTQLGLEGGRPHPRRDGQRDATGRLPGDFAEFLEFLRTDPRFYAKTPEELLKQASWIAKRMDGKLPSLFGRLPRQPYGVEPVPADLAPKYTGGRYVGAPLDGDARRRRTGSTPTRSTSRPLYDLEALTLHEAVPGHHLQSALAQELEAACRPSAASATSHAFGEGWGLYSEWLGLEAGFYTDPYSDFGRLTYEMWRACRLVVDTGLHAKGWTRQQAIDYLAAQHRAVARTRSRPRSTATSPGRARRSPTRWAS